MYYFFILPALILYPLLTCKITREVWKKSKSKRLTIITLAIFLLIPTWDVVIGYGIFLYKWATWSETRSTGPSKLPFQHGLTWQCLRPACGMN